MKSQRRLVVGVHAANHHVLALLRRALDERLHQRRADTAAPLVGADVDRVLDAEPVAGPRAEVTIRCEPEDA